MSEKKKSVATPQVAVWAQLEGMSPDELERWRVETPDNNRSDADRDIDKLPIPFGWFMLTYSDELAVGQVMPLHYFGQELVLWRGEDGQARMTHAYCKHLGAHMGYGGRVKGNNLECPFHAWEYNAQGSVVDVPYAKKVPPSAARPCKVQWEIREVNQQVLAWYHPFGEEPKWEPVSFDQVGDPDWTDYDKYEWIVHGPVQNMAENGVDAAHFLYIHGTKEMPEYDFEFDGHIRKASVDAPMPTPKGIVPGRISYGTVGPGQSWTKFEGITETLMIAGITPIDQGRTHIRFAFTQPRSEAEGPAKNLARAMRREICRQLDQDKVVWDRQKYMVKPSICDGDGPILPFRKFFSQFYAEWGETQKPIRSLRMEKKAG